MCLSNTTTNPVVFLRGLCLVGNCMNNVQCIQWFVVVLCGLAVLCSMRHYTRDAVSPGAVRCQTSACLHQTLRPPCRKPQEYTIWDSVAPKNVDSCINEAVGVLQEQC